MSNTKALGQRVKVVNIITPQDVASAATVNTNTGGYFDMSLYAGGTITVSAYLTATKTAIVQLTQSSAATATGKANVTGKTLTLTGGTGNTNEVGVIDFTTEELTSGAESKYFVGVDITTNEDGDDVAATLMAWGSRYKHKALNDDYDI